LSHKNSQLSFLERILKKKFVDSPFIERSGQGYLLFNSIIFEANMRQTFVSGKNEQL